LRNWASAAFPHLTETLQAFSSPKNRPSLTAPFHPPPTPSRIPRLPRLPRLHQHQAFRSIYLIQTPTSNLPSSTSSSLSIPPTYEPYHPFIFFHWILNNCTVAITATTSADKDSLATRSPLTPSVGAHVTVAALRPALKPQPSISALSSQPLYNVLLRLLRGRARASSQV
jgi:hypothetical protein